MPFSPRPQISHVVFDFDGTLSWLRHGWPDTMARLLREYIHPLPGETAAALHELLLREVLALNGKPPIYQMRRAAELATKRGGAKLDPESLLRVYLGRLEAVIRERSERIQRGETQVDEFVVRGARELLEQLEARGLTLIVLSGTSEPRVKMEADLLDLARFFGNHIYGGTADLAQSSKRAVLERLLRAENVAGARLLAFGDGPVEIELTKEFGGLAIGVASDEEVNGSGRMHPQKLSILREAGADLVIADYRDAGSLIERILTG